MNKVKLWFTAIVVLFLIFVGWRSTGYVSCLKDQYNLKRTTYFSWLTGACTIDSPKGRIYVNSLRGYDDDN